MHSIEASTGYSYSVAIHSKHVTFSTLFHTTHIQKNRSVSSFCDEPREEGRKSSLQRQLQVLRLPWYPRVMNPHLAAKH